MEMYKIIDKGVEFIEVNPFNLEKDIQKLIEKNTETFFGLEFVRSEFSIGEFRIDTLCYDNETFSCLPAIHQKLVVKPDQLIKRRGKLGLIKVNADFAQVQQWVNERIDKDIQVLLTHC